MQALPAYVELHCLSNFTFLRGASHAEELVARAKALGYGALTVTNECSFAGVVRAHVAAKQHGLKLIIGTEVQIDGGPTLVLLATNRESYGHIAMLITRARMRADKGNYTVTLDDLERNLDHCLVLLIPLPAPSPAGVANCAHEHADVPSSPTLFPGGEGGVMLPARAGKCIGAAHWQKTLRHARLLARHFPQRA